MMIGADTTGAQSLVCANGISAGEVRDPIQPTREWHDAWSMLIRYPAIYQLDVRSDRMVQIRDQTEPGVAKLPVVAGCRRCLNVPRAPRNALQAFRWMVSFVGHAFSTDVIRDPTLQGFQLILAPLTRYPPGQLSDLCAVSANRMAWTPRAIVASIGMPILARVR